MNKIESTIKRKIKRAKEIADKNHKKFSGNEQKYTYHGGFSSGYFLGKLAALEDIADMLEIDFSDLEQN